MGKTHLAGLLARAWAGEGPVVYRKPFQTGVASADDPASDAAAVRGPGIEAETGVVFREPLSPLAAAELEGRALDLEALARWAARPVPAGARLLLEGVGGVLVPLAPGALFLDWAAPLGFPALVVARGGLGTLSDTLLTCQALAARGVRVAAVVLDAGLDGSAAAARANAEVLRRFQPAPVHVLE